MKSTVPPASQQSLGYHPTDIYKLSQAVSPLLTIGEHNFITHMTFLTRDHLQTPRCAKAPAAYINTHEIPGIPTHQPAEPGFDQTPPLWLTNH